MPGPLQFPEASDAFGGSHRALAGPEDHAAPGDPMPSDLQEAEAKRSHHLARGASRGVEPQHDAIGHLAI